LKIGKRVYGGLGFQEVRHGKKSTRVVIRIQSQA
jgi:hypothetical protein